MANTLNGNTWYVDTQYVSASDDLDVKNLLVDYIFVTATAASAQVVLIDPSNSAVKFDLRVETADHTEAFSFEKNPIRCPNGLRVQTLTNAVATIVGSQSRGS